MSVPHVRLDDVVEVLRAADADRSPTPTVSQVRTLINDIWAMWPLDATAARPEMQGLSDLDLISIAEHFGKHRARVLKRGLAGKRERFDAQAAEVLFPPPESEVRQARELRAAGVLPTKLDKNGKAIANWRSKTNPKGFPRELTDALRIASTDWGSLPQGYDRDAVHGRDVHGSLAAVLAQPVEDPEIIRFVDRTYSTPDIPLEADHVQLFHWLVSNGLEVKLLDLTAKAVKVERRTAVLVPTGGTSNIPLAKLMVAAYDLLEVARADAVRALARVVRGQVTEAGQVRTELASAQWLAPGPIGKIVSICERWASNPDNTRLEQIYTSALATFCQSVRTRPDNFVVRNVAQMTSAHLAQVLTLSGLAVDDGEEKAAASELRTRLIEMGLRNDLDRELPEAMRAWRAGRLEEFYSSRHARLEGDPEWARLYALEEHHPVDAVMAT